jgi:hypothetical protein
MAQEMLVCLSSAPLLRPTFDGTGAVLIRAGRRRSSDRENLAAVSVQDRWLPCLSDGGFPSDGGLELGTLLGDPATQVRHGLQTRIVPVRLAGFARTTPPDASLERLVQVLPLQGA